MTTGSSTGTTPQSNCNLIAESRSWSIVGPSSTLGAPLALTGVWSCNFSCSSNVSVEVTWRPFPISVTYYMDSFSACQRPAQLHDTIHGKDAEENTCCKASKSYTFDIKTARRIHDTWLQPIKTPLYVHPLQVCWNLRCLDLYPASRLFFQ